MIQDIEFVFASVTTGEWTLAEFEAWCVCSRTVIGAAYSKGYNEGYNEGHDEGHAEGFALE